LIRVTSSGVRKATHSGSSSEQAHLYVLAGQPIVFQSKVMSLEAYAGGAVPPLLSESLVPPAQALLNSTNAELKYTGPAPFHQRQREVSYWRSGTRAQIDVDGVAVCQLELDQAHIHLLNDAPFDEGLNLEVTVGPALVLLLSQMGTFCLHAGAVSTSAGNIAFVAESGVGKSTLSTHAGNDWRQLSDDTLPVLLAHAESPKLCSDFPQLKFVEACVPDRPDGNQSLDFLIRLNPESSESMVLTQVKKPAAMLQIVRHTVAAKLFDASTLEQHVQFAKVVANVVPMFELNYPRKLSSLPELRTQIVEELIKR